MTAVRPKPGVVPCFIINAQVGGTMVPANFGISGGWWGLRAKPQFVDKFPTDNSDKRKNVLHRTDRAKDIADMFNFTDGYAVTKWTEYNIYRSFRPGWNSSGY